MGETREKKKRVVGPLNPLAGDGLILSVMNYEKREQKCGACGKVAVLFNAMDCRPRGDGGSVVICRCRACLEEYAQEKQVTLYLKTTCFGLETVWKNRRLPKAPPSTEKGLAALRARKEAEAAQR